MTRQEAVKVLKKDLKIIDDPKVTMTAREWEEHDDNMRDALEIAIEALEQQTDEIVRCKDCKYWHEWENGAGSCHRSDIMWVGSDYDDYCSFAERKEQ